MNISASEDPLYGVQALVIEEIVTQFKLVIASDIAILNAFELVRS